MPSTDFHCTPLCATLWNAKRRTCSHALAQRVNQKLFWVFWVEDTRKASKIFFAMDFFTISVLSRGLCSFQLRRWQGICRIPKMESTLSDCGLNKSLCKLLILRWLFSPWMQLIGTKSPNPMGSQRANLVMMAWRSKKRILGMSWPCVFVGFGTAPRSRKHQKTPDRSRVKYHKDWVTKADISALSPFWQN